MSELTGKWLLEAKNAEIARLTAELQLAWNTCEEAETNARRLQEIASKYEDRYFELRERVHEGVRELALKVLEKGEGND